MRTTFVVLVLAAAAAGCTARRTTNAPMAEVSRYLEGFMEGYRSAYPDRPYAKDGKTGLDPSGFDVRSRAYRKGWKDGHEIGSQDVEQRE